MAQHAHEQSDRYIGNPEYWIKHRPPLARHAAIWLVRIPLELYCTRTAWVQQAARPSRPRS
jgi:hypothetical protein